MNYFVCLCADLIGLATLPAHATELHRLDLGIANVYLLKGKQPLLIDSGPHGRAAEVESWLKSHGVAPEQLAAVILTHGHADHAGGAYGLAKKRGIPVWAGAGDEDMLTQGKNRPLQPTTLIAGLIRIGVDLPYPAYTPDTLISGPVDLKPYGINGQVVPLPGHTHGSLIVVLDDNNSAIVGDLLRGGVLNNSLPRVHFFHENRAQTQWQLWKLLEHEGIKTFYPGHFGPLQAADVKRTFFPHGRFQWGIAPGSLDL
jgi:hydroxyacylglutathione hydrolase